MRDPSHLCFLDRPVERRGGGGITYPATSWNWRPGETVSAKPAQLHTPQKPTPKNTQDSYRREKGPTESMKSKQRTDIQTPVTSWLHLATTPRHQLTVPPSDHHLAAATPDHAFPKMAKNPDTHSIHPLHFPRHPLPHKRERKSNGKGRNKERENEIPLRQGPVSLSAGQRRK